MSGRSRWTELTVSGDRGEIAVKRRLVLDPRRRDRRRRRRRGQRPARAGRGAVGDARRRIGECAGRRQRAPRGRSARGDPCRSRPRARGSARNGPRAESQRHEQRRHQDVSRARRSRTDRCSLFDACATSALRDHPALRREDPGPGDAGAQSLGREPPEARPRTRVRGRSARPRCRAADARARRRRDRDRALVPSRGRGRRASRSCS